MTITEAMKAGTSIDFTRAGSTFHGTLVEPTKYDGDGNDGEGKGSHRAGRLGGGS
ncbi:hypothetical protein [Streptomyces sp. NPDC088762]|uniref:hypothetical protein n=1 Tax=Streptomyces sp. NPDC088762 TaxID=3365891 RepID=UPI00380CAB53